MPKRVAGLTAVRVRTAPPGRYADGNGLYLLVRDTERWWVMRYRLGSADRELGLGAAEGRGSVTLAQARAAAEQHRLSIRAGIDPLEQRRAARAALEASQASAKRDAMSFRTVAGLYIDDHRESWKHPKHRAQWVTSLEKHAMPLIGDKPVAGIETDDVLAVLRPIWGRMPETASRVRGRIETVLDYAGVRGWRNGDNPARWRGHLQGALPATGKVQKVVHYAALPWREISRFMPLLRAEKGNSARALEWTILTAARTGETIGARWDEMDLAAAVWTVPASRMKAGAEHRVPLSAAALDVLAAAEPGRDRSGGYVFAGGKDGQPLSNMAMAMLLRRMGRTDITAHGFRSTFRDWCGEMTDTPREIAEACLAHSVGNKVEAAYRRGDALDKRRAVMEAWATFCLFLQ